MLLTLFQNNVAGGVPVYEDGVAVSSTATVSTSSPRLGRQVLVSSSDNVSVLTSGTTQRSVTTNLNTGSSVAASVIVNRIIAAVVASTTNVSGQTSNSRTTNGTPILATSNVYADQLSRINQVDTSPITSASDVEVGVANRITGVFGATVSSTTANAQNVTVNRSMAAPVNSSITVNSSASLQLTMPTTGVASNTNIASYVVRNASTTATLTATTFASGAGALNHGVTTAIESPTSIVSLPVENRNDTVQPILVVTDVSSQMTVARSMSGQVIEHSHVVASDVEARQGMVGVISAASGVLGIVGVGRAVGGVSLNSTTTASAFAGHLWNLNLDPITTSGMLTSTPERALGLMVGQVDSGTSVDSASVAMRSMSAPVSQPTSVTGRSVLRMTAKSYVNSVVSVNPALSAVLRSVGVQITDNTSVTSLVSNLRRLTSSPITSSDGISDSYPTVNRGGSAYITSETRITGLIAVLRIGSTTVNVTTDLQFTASRVANVIAKITDIVTTQYSASLARGLDGAEIDANVYVTASAVSHGLHANFTMTVNGTVTTILGTQIYIGQSTPTQTFNVKGSNTTSVMLPTSGSFTITLPPGVI